VLVIREGNLLGTGIIDDTPAVGALVPDDEECNICYWFGICEAPEPYRPVDTVDGTFTYCAFSTTELSTFRPVDTVDGTFTYCTFDLTNSGFDRTP
jgi:hypothetical protein